MERVEGSTLLVLSPSDRVTGGAVCVWMQQNKSRQGLRDEEGGLLPVLLVSWQVRSPFCQRPHPQLNYCQTPRFLLFLLRVQFGQQSPPLCSGSWADVLKHVDGSLRIPICCPWRCARGAGNGCLCCRRYRELFSYTGSARISGHWYSRLMKNKKSRCLEYLMCLWWMYWDINKVKVKNTYPFVTIRSL